MKGIYLAAGRALHSDYDIVYQDIDESRDLGGDMLSYDLNDYDFVIASPPCNFWSRARGNRCSDYALVTKHLLPDILFKLSSYNKPFIVENVRNYNRMLSENIFPLHYDNMFVYFYGRHTYFTNVMMDLTNIKQRKDFINKGNGCRLIKYSDMDSWYRQGGYNVHNVIDYFLEVIHD